MTIPEAVVKVNGSEHYRTELSEEEIARGWIETPCPECRGTGQFVMPEGDTQDCVHCSSSGTVMASLPPLVTGALAILSRSGHR